MRTARRLLASALSVAGLWTAGCASADDPAALHAALRGEPSTAVELAQLSLLAGELVHRAGRERIVRTLEQLSAGA